MKICQGYRYAFPAFEIRRAGTLIVFALVWIVAGHSNPTLAAPSDVAVPAEASASSGLRTVAAIDGDFVTVVRQPRKIVDEAWIPPSSDLLRSVRLGGGKGHAIEGCEMIESGLPTRIATSRDDEFGAVIEVNGLEGGRICARKLDVGANLEWEARGASIRMDASANGEVIVGLEIIDERSARLHRYDAASGTIRWTRDVRDPAHSSLRPVAVSRDGKIAAALTKPTDSRGASARILFFDAGTGAPAGSLDLSAATDEASLALASNGSVVVVSTRRSTHVGDRETRTWRTGFHGVRGNVSTISREGDDLIVGGSELVAYAWTGTHYAERWRRANVGFSVSSLALSEDRGTLVAGWCRRDFRRNLVEVFDTHDSRPRLTLFDEETDSRDRLQERPSAIAVSHDGRRFAVGTWGSDSRPAKLRVFRREHPVPLAVVETPGSVLDVRLDPRGDDEWVATAGVSSRHANLPARRGLVVAVRVAPVSLQPGGSGGLASLRHDAASGLDEEDAPTARDGDRSFDVLMGNFSVGDTATGGVFGRVRDGSTSRPVDDVVIEALRDGAEPVASATTDADGIFRIRLPEGVYDLRARDAAGVFGASVLHDLPVFPFFDEEVNLELVRLDRMLIDRGFDPSDFVDADGDLLPDAVEWPAGLAADNGDTDHDGIRDGIEAWIGSDPFVEEAGSLEALVVLEPVDGDLLPMPDGAVPIPLRLENTPGATGYRLELYTNVHRRLVAEATLDFSADDVIIGEETWLRWVPPPIDAGSYELHVYALRLDEVVSLPATLRLEFTGIAAHPYEIETDIRSSGDVLATSIVVRSGVTWTVPAGEHLRLVTRDDLVIEEGASIVSEVGDSADDRPAGTIDIRAGGEVRVAGLLATGNGAVGAPDTAGRSYARGEAGGDGGELRIAASGPILVTRTGRIVSGDGGDGGDATALGEDAGHAEAIGGDGGSGGNLCIFAPAVHVADRPGRIVVGHGGSGGDADALGGDTDDGFAFASEPQSAHASCGAGGDSGLAWLSHWDVRGDGLLLLDDESSAIQGGKAGEPGKSRLRVGAPLASTLEDIPFQDGREHVSSARAGGNGWRRAGAGCSSIARGTVGVGSGNGGGAVALGGRGGDLLRMGLGYRGLQSFFAFRAIAGAGGGAVATGGRGGDDEIMGGFSHGGDTSAWGGVGGDGLAMLSPVHDIGGDGGSAESHGGRGGRGGSACNPPDRAGNGSDGGIAEAYGGTGGLATKLGGKGGSAIANGGAGGRGGDGVPPGHGGLGGGAQSEGGTGGLTGVPDRNLGEAAPSGDHESTPGAAGEDGNSCGSEGGRN